MKRWIKRGIAVSVVFFVGFTAGTVWYFVKAAPVPHQGYRKQNTMRGGRGGGLRHVSNEP